ncbi:hypothetical protein [Marinobacter segnicrescens]|uniref:hypothetical protein n=1 Tax=Marinobacter segnicrescens TaxID=430453 RepID=UPI00115FF0C8|nr:hypothetical protein [Marinobacter segnicrescens]
MIFQPGDNLQQIPKPTPGTGRLRQGPQRGPTLVWSHALVWDEPLGKGWWCIFVPGQAPIHQLGDPSGGHVMVCGNQLEGSTIQHGRNDPYVGEILATLFRGHRLAIHKRPSLELVPFGLIP